MNDASVEHTSIGRIVVPYGVPEGFTLFYTTVDFDGAIGPQLLDIGHRSPVAGRRGLIASCDQIHGPTIHRVSGDRRPATGEPICDALWTDQRNTALAIKVADCLPVTLIDPAGVIANIHSGWRGAVQNITAATLDAAALDRSTTVAFLGPSIRVCCFEVGEEVAEKFDPAYVDRTLGAKPHVDIARFTAGVLQSGGVTRIVDTGLCTRCEGSVFHSYRRDKRSGRNLAIVAQ